MSSLALVSLCVFLSLLTICIYMHTHICIYCIYEYIWKKIPPPNKTTETHNNTYVHDIIIIINSILLHSKIIHYRLPPAFSLYKSSKYLATAQIDVHCHVRRLAHPTCSSVSLSKTCPSSNPFWTEGFWLRHKVPSVM